ncbi:MAG: prolyl aminopeptidase [Propionibacteriaceae bacterium]
MADPFPPAEPYEAGMLEVGEGHQVYWEQVGNPDGLPAVFLHGGPGSGCTPGARATFDPALFRAVLFDQRGSGRSRPLAGTSEHDLATNTTDHLVADLERLREHLGIERWIVVGVSWGVTLGLVYAERFPERVSGMVLGAVTAGSERAADWITRQMGRLFPREWDEFVAIVPEAARQGDLTAAYAALLADPDPAVRAEAALRWCRWEDVHVSLAPDWAPSPRYADPEFRLRFATLVTHYWSHADFLEPDEIMTNLGRLADIPAVLIHGRYDVSGPLDTAYRLHQAWPGSELVVLGDAGHGGGSFAGEMISALGRLHARLS